MFFFFLSSIKIVNIQSIYQKYLQLLPTQNMGKTGHTCSCLSAIEFPPVTGAFSRL